MARAQNKHTAGSATRYVAGMARKLREKQGLSQRELGERTGFTAAAISAMETCAQPASDQMLIALEEVMGGGLGLFESAREFVRLEKYPAQFKDYALLEQEAVARKSLFSREPIALIELVLDESVLRRAIGDATVMRNQLHQLTEYAQRRNVTLQVLPMNRGLRGEHAGMRGEMKLVETPDHDHVVYLEPQDESLLISDPVKVSTYAQRYAKIRSQALDPYESVRLIEQLAGERE